MKNETQISPKNNNQKLIKIIKEMATGGNYQVKNKNFFKKQKLCAHQNSLLDLY